MNVLQQQLTGTWADVPLSTIHDAVDQLEAQLHDCGKLNSHHFQCVIFFHINPRITFSETTKFVFFSAPYTFVGNDRLISLVLVYSDRQPRRQPQPTLSLIHI